MIEKRPGELEILWKVSNLLHSTLNLNDVLNLALEQAVYYTMAAGGTLWLLDAAGEYLAPVAARGTKSEVIRGLKLKNGQGLAGWVCKERKTQLVTDVRRDARWASSFDQETGFQTSSLLCVPLYTETTSIGCLQLVNRADDESFTEEDLRLCESLSAIISVAIVNSRLYTELKNVFSSFIGTLSSALDARDPYTAGHSARVNAYCLMMAEALYFDKEHCEFLEQAALLHDIGKIGVHDNVLKKTGPLSDEEMNAMKKHPCIGSKILQEIKPLHVSRELSVGAASHHERFDGNGYPRGLAGEDIPLVARIITIADAFDAMTSKRSYRGAFSVEKALAELAANSGSQFDPILVSVFIECVRNDEMLYFMLS